ncbi:MAG: tRNA dihydrouridine synthase DusB, partial [Chlorobia bacterium]|nr:tRNA dihydrouridine synthase DusB [Fimbriimonadaceae bacterium]
MASSTRSSFSISDIRVDPPLLLAPMEDVTNLPFRLIAKRVANPGLMFTEFVSAMAIHYGAKKTLQKMRIHPDERPLGIQIFGGEPDVMAETARVAEEMGADIVDINMGCWVPKVCKTGSGAALLKDPDMAEKIVRSVVNAVKVPVTVKVRAGWDYSLFAAPELARRFQGAGAQMITLHARFAKQGFEGEADWSLIQQIRDAVQVPLIGNGDVKSADDARRMLRETGCDGVMVGRAAISNPWALRDIQLGMRGLPPGPVPALGERVQVALEHLRMMVACEAESDSYEEALDAPGFHEAEMRKPGASNA